MTEITGILLAGGKSTRMGQDKAFLPYFGKKLIDFNLYLLKAICNEVLISANGHTYNTFDLPIIPDINQSMGPIGGLHACLKYSSNEYNLFLTCDMPFVNQGLVYGLLSHIDEGYDIIAYTYNNKIEPLMACYSKKILPVVQKQIAARNYKLQSLFKNQKIKLIPLESKILVANINSKADIRNTQNLFKWKLPNMILISGDGRNVGKTFFACSIIKHLSKQNMVIAIKTSSHFHDSYEQAQVIKETDDYKIIDEKNLTTKDSSLMLQAGASKTYFIMAKKKDLSTAFKYLENEIKNKVIVAESGELSEIINPGFFFLVKRKGKQIQKTQYLKYQPTIVENNLNGFDFKIENIVYKQNYLTLEKYCNGNI